MRTINSCKLVLTLHRSKAMYGPVLSLDSLSSWVSPNCFVFKNLIQEFWQVFGLLLIFPKFFLQWIILSLWTAWRSMHRLWYVRCIMINHCWINAWLSLHLKIQYIIIIITMYHQDLPECLQAYRRHAIQYGFHRWMDGYEWKTSCQLSSNLGKQNLSHLRKDRFGAAFPSSSSLPFAQSCPTLCDPMDSSLPGSAVHGIFQARILEWAAISFSRGSSQPRDRTRVSCIADRRFTIWANSLPKFSNF